MQHLFMITLGLMRKNGCNIISFQFQVMLYLLRLFSFDFRITIKKIISLPTSDKPFPSISGQLVDWLLTYFMAFETELEPSSTTLDYEGGLYLGYRY